MAQTIEERKDIVFSLGSTHKGEGGSEGQDLRTEIFPMMQTEEC